MPQPSTIRARSSGSYTDAGGVSHGFLYSNGVYTTLDDPSATVGTGPIAINNSSQVVGTYQDGAGSHELSLQHWQWRPLHDA